MSHNNSICKFRNYSRDSSLAAHDFSTKFRRHLFYRGQPSPAFRDAESVRRQLSRGGRQTAAQRRGWGRRCGKRMPTATQRWGCWQRHREVYGRRHREQLPMTARKGVREGHGERMPTATQRWGCRRRCGERMPTEAQRRGCRRRRKGGNASGNADGRGRGAAAGRPPRVIDSKAGDSVLNFLPFL